MDLIYLIYGALIVAAIVSLFYGVRFLKRKKIMLGILFIITDLICLYFIFYLIEFSARVY
jgi:hypothetical protein